MKIIKMINGFVIILFVMFCFLPMNAMAQAPTTVLEAGNYDNTKPCPKSCSTITEPSELAACKKYCGDYQVNDFLNLGVRITNIILGIVGALALLAFVAGGVMFLVSAGNNSLVERGKSTIIGAVIGLLVVFASYTIVSFTAKALGVKSDGIFNSSWFQK